MAPDNPKNKQKTPKIAIAVGKFFVISSLKYSYS